MLQQWEEAKWASCGWCTIIDNNSLSPTATYTVLLHTTDLGGCSDPSSFLSSCENDCLKVYWDIWSLSLCEKYSPCWHQLPCCMPSRSYIMVVAVWMFCPIHSFSFGIRDVSALPLMNWWNSRGSMARQGSQGFPIKTFSYLTCSLGCWRKALQQLRIPTTRWSCEYLICLYINRIKIGTQTNLGDRAKEMVLLTLTK